MSFPRLHLEILFDLTVIFYKFVIYLRNIAIALFKICLFYINKANILQIRYPIDQIANQYCSLVLRVYEVKKLSPK